MHQKNGMDQFSQYLEFSITFSINCVYFLFSHQLYARDLFDINLCCFLVHRSYHNQIYLKFKGNNILSYEVNIFDNIKFKVVNDQ